MGTFSIPTSLDVAETVGPDITSGPVYLDNDLTMHFGAISTDPPGTAEGTVEYLTGSNTLRIDVLNGGDLELHRGGGGNGVSVTADGRFNFLPADSATGELFALCDVSMDRDVRMLIENDSGGTAASAEYRAHNNEVGGFRRGIKVGILGSAHAGVSGVAANQAFVSAFNVTGTPRPDLVIQTVLDGAGQGNVIFQTGATERARFRETTADGAFQLTSNSVLEFQDQAAGVSAANQARIRYNNGLTQLEMSVNGGAYAPIAAGGASPWQTTGTVTNLVTSTDEVTVGSANNLAKLAVDGDDDQIQFLVQGHSTQTSDLVVFENSAGTNLFTFDGTGLGYELNSGGILLNERADHAYTPAAGKGEFWVKDDTPCKPYFTDDAGTDFDLTSGGGSAGIKWWDADQLESPNSADWTVNSLAGLDADEDNTGLNIRAFDDTTEEGVGFSIPIPSGTTSIKLYFRGRAKTAPGAARTVGLKLYFREVPDNAAVTAWSAGTQLTDIDIPTNENFQYDNQTITLASLGITAGRDVQFELTRIDPSGGVELTGDWFLLRLGIEFI